MLSMGSIVKKSASSVFWCMQSLRKPKREAMYTLFAFCRHIDSIISLSVPVEEKEELLKAWREELDNIYEKKVPTTDIGRKIYKNCMRFNLPKDEFIQILHSASMNIPTPLQAPSMSTFDEYLAGSAVAPIDLSLRIMTDFSADERKELSENLGFAVLVTYILREIKDEAKSNRILIPREILEKSGVNESLPTEVIENKNLIQSRIELSYLAEESFAKAEQCLAKINKGEILPLVFIYNVSRCFFEKMKKRGWEIISPKPKIGFWQKVKIICKSM